jgi:hypothetical protein
MIKKYPYCTAITLFFLVFLLGSALNSDNPADMLKQFGLFGMVMIAIIGFSNFLDEKDL